MTLVVDSSVVIAALIDRGAVGEWAEAVLLSEPLAAPHLLPVEVANILRRSEVAGDITADVGALAHQDLVNLQVELFPYRWYANRVWELRPNCTCYEAWYVAVAESLGARLATLDLRLSRAAGIRCEFVVPPTEQHPPGRR